jgi:hypothetical protein
MASVMDAYDLLQKAARAGTQEETQALVQQAKDTLKQNVSGKPANSGTTVDTQDDLTATQSSGNQLQLDERFAGKVGQREGRVVEGIEIPYWVDDDYLSSYVTSVQRGNPRAPNNREMTELIAGVPIEQLYATTNQSYWSKITSASSELLYGAVGSNIDNRNWEEILDGVTSGEEAYIKSWTATADMISNSAIAQPFNLKEHGIKIGNEYLKNEAGEYADGRKPSTWGIDTVQTFGRLVIFPADPFGLSASGTDTDLMMGVMSGDGVMLRTATTDTSVLWKYGVGQDDINAANLYLQNTYDFDNNDRRYSATSHLRSFFNATKNYDPSTAMQTSYQNLFSDFKPFIPSTTTTGTSTSTTSSNTGTQQTGTTQQQATSTETDTDTDAVSMAANQAIQTQQDLPQTVSYQMPQGYQGSGFLPTYMDQTGMGMQTPTMIPMTGTFTKPAGTGMMNYGGGQSYFMGQSTTQTPTSTEPVQYEVRIYRNNAGMTTSITFVNGQPQTPIPSGFYPVDAQPAGQTPFQPQVAPQAPVVQGAQQPQAPQVNAPQVPTVTPVTGYTPQFMNQGGIVPPIPTPSGNKFGGFKPEALQRIAQNLGYSGDMGDFDQYLNNNPDKKQKMDNYTTRARKMAEGGMVPKQAMIGGEPHRLAYVNPNEEKLLKAAGGAGVPSYGNIPAYFSIGPGSTVGQTVTDPTTGTVYTWNGSSWTTGDGYDVGTGMGSVPIKPPPAPEETIQYAQTLPPNSPIYAATTSDTTTVDIQQYNPRALNQQYIPQQPDYTGQNITQVQASLAKTPGLPTGATVVPTGTQLTAGQLVSPYSGQVAGSVALPTALAGTEQAMMPVTGQAALMSPVEAAGAIGATVNQTQAAQIGQVAQIDAAQLEESSLSQLKAAQGTGIAMDNPVQREIQDGELISGAANAQKAAEFTEQIEAANAQPSTKATVAGQLEVLMQQFEGGNTPPWAAASMRNAMATLSARGLGASSLAGQAVIQAAMESALPIAQVDAQTQAQFEQQNLSNRQQRAILAAQQRAQFLGQEFDQAFQARVANAAKVSDIANMNFTAEQQVALENSRIANTMELTNLANSQAVVMAEAAALANIDMANLNNRQQAAVQNAQNFLQADLTNLSNKQQTELFKAQQRVQALFTDQAAINAAQQFNATSQNQVDQFFASLQSNTAQFNASQANAQAQFNAGQVNVIERFNAEINNQRDQFNAQNRLIIDQSNAQWRREIATADTAAVNRANEINAQALLGYSQQAYNNLWNYYADNMEWAWTSAENERQRYMNLAIAKLQSDTSITLAEMKADYESSAGFGSLIGKILTTDLTNTFLGGIFG